MNTLLSSVVRVDPLQLPEPAARAWLAAKGSQGLGLRHFHPLNSSWSRRAGEAVLRFRIDGVNSPDGIRVLEASWMDGRIQVRLEWVRFEGLLGANLMQTALIEVDLTSLPIGKFELEIVTERKGFSDLNDPNRALHRGMDRAGFQLELRD